MADNLLLSAIPEDDQKILRSAAKLVELRKGQVLCAPNESTHYVFFPASAVVCHVSLSASGATLETAVVGFEGMTGLSALLGGTSPYQTVVQIAGEAFRVELPALEDRFSRSAELRRLLLRYTQALMTHITQVGLCNSFHPAAKRFCRWMLILHDRMRSDELPLTQDLVAHMLGVRRPTVTAIVNVFEQAGIIESRRGRIRVMNRQALQSSSCECYGVVQGEYLRLFSRADREPAGRPRRRPYPDLL